jgi:predicted RNA binding protein YcfA (HicA-like mRNA interferase family)
MCASICLAASRDATLACVRAREVCRRIERLGGVHDSTKGSHRSYVVEYGDGRRCRTAVPIHPGDVKVGTLHVIERDLEPAFGKRWLSR